MTNPRIRTRDTSDDEMVPRSRVVAPRRSIFSEDSDPTEHLNHTTEPSDESDPEEEPFEDEEDPQPTRSRSPSALPPSVPASPTIPPSPVYPPLRFSTCHQGDTLRWDWMPTILDWWRRAEQLPVLPDVPGSSTPTLTQEPAHHTIPILITRLVTHDHQLDQLERAAHDRMNVSEVRSEMAEMSDAIVSTHGEGVETQGEVAALRLRVEQGESRIEQGESRIAELEQEMATMRADMVELRAAAASSTRMVGLLEDMIERLDRPL